MLFYWLNRKKLLTCRFSLTIDDGEILKKKIGNDIRFILLCDSICVPLIIVLRSETYTLNNSFFPLCCVFASVGWLLLFSIPFYQFYWIYGKISIHLKGKTLFYWHWTWGNKKNIKSAHKWLKWLLLLKIYAKKIIECFFEGWMDHLKVKRVCRAWTEICNVLEFALLDYFSGYLRQYS